MSQDPIRSTILIFALAAAVTMAPVAPEAGNILYLGAGAAALFLMRASAMNQLQRPVVWMPLLGLTILAATFAFGAGSLQGALGIFYFAPVLAIYPLLSLLERGAPLSGSTIATLCLCGVAGAAAVAVNELATTETARAGATVANPIHFADVALAAGFLAMIGSLYVKGFWRYVYFLGPIFATVAVLLSGSRGPILALVIMAVTAVCAAVISGLVTRRILLIGIVASVGIVVVALAGGVLHTTGIERILPMVRQILESGLPQDSSTAERMQMYEGGLLAFAASPVFGHGPFAYVAAAAEHAGGTFTPPHLHSDIVDFAASGGMLGLAAYLLILLAPIAEALAAPASQTKKGVVIIATTLSTGYFAMGLTNAMLGILTATVLFSAIALVIGIASRDLSGTEPAQDE
jgi:O-antigen ligase